MNEPPRARMGKRAIVIGGSIAGVLAARVLSDHFDEVIVLEKDRLPNQPMKRKGAPQAKHVHILLLRGARIIQGLLPGLADDMEAAGALPHDIARDVRWRQAGVWKANFESGITVYIVNRVAFEFHLRRRVGAIANVEILAPFEVLRLAHDDDGRVTGVVAFAREEGSEDHIEADLVVDAGGRGTRTPRWLEAMGFGKPRETEVKVNLAYASRLCRAPPRFQRDRIPLALFPHAPAEKRFGIIFPLGERGVIVTLGGWCRDHPPRQPRGYMQFAESLGFREFVDILRIVRPAPSIHTYQFPSSLWRRYESMKRWPDRYLVIGDAYCSFNPAYGQGMSVCAIEADILQRRLARLARRGRSVAERGQARKLQRRVAGAVVIPFLLASCEDFRYEEVTGPSLPGLGALQWYVSHLLELSASDPFVLRRFYLVMSLVRTPVVLFHPRVIWAVVRNALRRLRKRRAAGHITADAGSGD